MSSTLNVNISDEALTFLTENRYVLAIAKQVNGSYTVVWKGHTELLAKNTFQWKPEYELFGQNNFTAGLLVQESTSDEPISGGQTCELSAQGVLSTPSGTPIASEPFYMKSNYTRPIHACVNAVIDGKSLPIFACPYALIPGGTQSLLPVEKIMLWFGQDISSRTMISKIVGPSIELDYTSVATHTVQFTDQLAWTTLPSPSSNYALLSADGALEDPITVTGAIVFLVKFVGTEVGKAVVQETIRYVKGRLFGDGTPAEDVKEDEDDIEVIAVQFSKQHAMSQVHHGIVPPYKENVENALQDARAANVLPATATWTVEQPLSGSSQEGR